MMSGALVSSQSGSGSQTQSGPLFSAAQARLDFCNKWQDLWAQRVGPWLETRIKSENSVGNTSFEMSWGDFGHATCGIFHSHMGRGDYEGFKDHVIKQLQALGYRAEHKSEVDRIRRKSESIPRRRIYVSWG